MPTWNVLVTHERQRWNATTVDIEAPSGLSNREYEALGREHLRQHDYLTYLLVTEHPQPPDHTGPNYEARMKAYLAKTGNEKGYR